MVREKLSHRTRSSPRLHQTEAERRKQFSILCISQTIKIKKTEGGAALEPSSAVQVRFLPVYKSPGFSGKTNRSPEGTRSKGNTESKACIKMDKNSISVSEPEQM